LFFARYELSEIGGTTIETEHLLLGLLKANDPVLAHLLETASVNADALRQQIHARVVPGSPVPQSVVEFKPQLTRHPTDVSGLSDRFRCRASRFFSLP
jgi:ATP-dependent Clp protease ATP-binding subunit ClpA